VKPVGVAILGSTGSIGTQTLDVIRHLPGRFRVVGLAAKNNVDLLADQVAEFHVPYVAVDGSSQRIEGARTISKEDLVRLPEVDVVVVATPGTSALRPTLAAIEAGHRVATANKEVLVAAGELVVAAAQRRGVELLPIDSEHNAVWQCLRGEEGRGIAAGATVERIVLTASGGAFRDLPLEQLDVATLEGALRHPIWQMGQKVTIDAATLANKAFEVVEARWLFDVPYERIDVVLHRESVVHSVVQFVDGSSKAQLGLPDMRLPIQYALTYPDRAPSQVAHLDLARLGSLSFAPVDDRRYPVFRAIVEAGRAGGTCPAVASAANDVGVEQFVAGCARFTDIAAVVEATLDKHQRTDQPSVEEIVEAEEQARAFARGWLETRARSTSRGG
jgi:1-deoxy-D-xylulose-5-phosphate reductoisomerase